MNRGGALTLGAILMLGGMTGGRGDELSGPDVTSNAGAFPSWGGVFPRLPQNWNWSDLPVQFKLSDSVGYNSNVLGLANNTPLTSGLVRGDFQSISSYGASTKAYWGGQQLFADGSFGLTQYLRDVRLNSMQHAMDAGVNWTYTSRCSGKLVASESVAESTLAQQFASASAASFTSAQTLAQQIASGSTTPSPIPQPVAPGSTAVGPVPQQIASTANNSVSTTAFNETATCHVSTDYDAIFNSGTTRSTNSTLVNKVNDFRNDFVAAGISYNVTATNSLQVLATISGISYPNHPPATNNLGLVNAITQDSVTLTYTRQIDPNLSAIGSIGAVGLANGSFSLALPSKIEPQYSASVIWAVTPKVNLSASVARTVTPPQAVVANAQTTESAALTLNYQFSAKTTFSASVSTASATSAFTQPGGGLLTGVPPSALGSPKSYTASASLAYNITPFLGVNLSYLYSSTPQSLVLLNVNYNPY